MVDLVSMPMGVGQMKYLVLAREDFTNQVEGRALTNKTMSAVCKFLLEEVICRYQCVGKIVADQGELDAREATELFERLGVKLSLTTAYNPEGMGRSIEGMDRSSKPSYGHAMVESEIGHDFFPMPCGPTERHTTR